MGNLKVRGEQAFKITGDWAVQATNLKEKYTLLTDEDLEFEVNKEESLLQRIGKKLNKKREEVIKIIKKDAPAKLF